VRYDISAGKVTALVVLFCYSVAMTILVEFGRFFLHTAAHVEVRFSDATFSIILLL